MPLSVDFPQIQFKYELSIYINFNRTSYLHKIIFSSIGTVNILSIDTV